MLLSLRDLVSNKPHGLAMIDARTPLRRAIHVLNEVRTGAVLVAERGRMVGIVTERYVLRAVVACDPVDLTAPLSAVMTAPVCCAPANTSADDAMRMMATREHRHLVVVDAGKPIGILSIGDLMGTATRELERWVVDLSTFISGPAASVELPSSELRR